MSQGRPPLGTDFAWEQAEKRLEAQVRQADALDTKAGTLVGIHVVAAGIVATAAGRLHGANRWVGVGVVAGLVIGGWFAFKAFLVQAYNRQPSPQALWNYGEHDEAQIRFRFLSTRFRSLEENRIKLDEKAGSVVWSLRVLAVVGLAVAVTTIVELIV